MVDYLITRVLKINNEEKKFYILDGLNTGIIKELNVLKKIKFLKKDKLYISPITYLERDLLEFDSEFNDEEKIPSGNVENFIYYYLEEAYGLKLKTNSKQENKKFIQSLLSLDEKEMKSLRCLLEKLSVEKNIPNATKKQYVYNFVKNCSKEKIKY